MAVGISKTFWNGHIPQNGMARSTAFSPVWSNSPGHLNRLYFGDNLAVLADLATDPKVKGKVTLTYIDPPYSTNSIFQTRDQENAYSDLLTGEDYLAFLGERLSLIRELLSENGSIYVHLDCNMVFHAKILMDDIFGTSNFKGMITRQKCKPKNYTRKTYGNISDYILFYSKSASPVWNRSYDEWSEEKTVKEYSLSEPTSGRRYKKVPIHAPGVRNGETGKEWRGMLPPAGKHWQYTPQRLEEMDINGEIYWSANGNPRRKVYLDQSEGIPVQDIWLDYIDTNNQNTLATGYPTEKNLEMLKRIILASSNEGDLVLDCFAGSGSTLVAASGLGRQWNGADIGETAIQTILTRFAHGSSKLGDFVSQNGKQNSASLTLFDTEPVKSRASNQKRINDFSFFMPENQVFEQAELLTQLA